MGQIRQLRDVRGTALRATRRVPADVPGGVVRARPTASPTAADLEPIEGVSLALYAEISKCLAAVGYDQSLAPGIAAAKGVATDAWEHVANGWNARIRADPSIARRFNELYVGS